MKRRNEVREERNVTAEDGVEYHLSYSLITVESEEWPGVMLYGIGIAMIRTEGSLRQEEADEVPCLTDSRELAENWLNTLAAEAVTPLCLAEILDDLVTEQEKYF